MQSGDPGPRRTGWLGRPSPKRLTPDDACYDETIARHDRAVAAGMSTYVDPATGYVVMTAAYLGDRNACCDSGCRHCPWADAVTGPEAN